MKRPALFLAVFTPFLMAASSPEGCSPSSDDSSDGSTACVARTGNQYTAHYTERSGGTCGAIPDQTAGDASADAMCSGSATDSTDLCTTTIDATCTGGDGAPYTDTGTAKWSADGTTGTAVLTYVIYDNGPDQPATCTSIYDVTYAKQVAVTPPTQ